MRKRSKYKPRQTLLDPVGWVINGLRPMREHAEATTLKIKNHAAMTDITRGEGGRHTVDILIAAMNMAEALQRVNPDLGADYAPEIRAAQDALLTLSRRGLEKGRFLFTGVELQAMNDGMAVHDAQLDACNIAELEKALDLVTAEIRHKRARVIDIQAQEAATA